MPTQTTFPGVYIEEIPSGVRTITGVSTSITAFVGYTPQGPFNDATRILSPGDYERSFGPLHRDSPVSYAVRQFFENGGGDAYVVRVAQNVATAAVTLEATDGTEVLTLTASNPGRWANGIRVDIDYDTSNPDSTFNLSLTQFDATGGVAAAETHRNLSMDSDSGGYVVDVVNATSVLATADRDPGLTFTDGGRSLSGDLSTAFTVTDPAIVGSLDGNPLSLLLTGSLPTTPATLETSLTGAIAAAGLTVDLVAERADPNGVAAAAGDHVQLRSTDTGERSEVTITGADPALRLGLANGGREFAGAANRRPAANGTSSGDLTDRMGANLTLGSLAIEVVDRSPGGATLVATTGLTPSTSTMGTGLRDALQAAIRAIANPATENANVELIGGRIRMTASADTPNATINVTAGGGANGLRTDTAQGGFQNLQSYAMGTGADFAAQTGVTAGADGTPPTATELIGSYEAKTGIHALRDVDIFNILVIPETATLCDSAAASVIDAGINFCDRERAFYIVDPRSNRTFDDIADWVDGLPKAKNAAVYFPRIVAPDPLSEFRPTDMAASGAMAGIYARTDSERGVWKSPAGTEAGIRGTVGLRANLTDPENGVLNPKGINTLRAFPTYGRVSWGARTLDGADARASEWKYLAVRRTALFIEESLYRGLQWAVFEPNDEPLWAELRLNVGAFMHDLFRKGAFQGTSPREAYIVKCDSETTTQNDINLGVVNVLVGFAPLKPAEFVILKIQQLAGQQS